MKNYQVHFCYLDAIEALIGRYVWRYEVMPRRAMYSAIVELSKKGMDGFRYREFGVPYSEWVMVDTLTAKRVVASGDHPWERPENQPNATWEKILSLNPDQTVKE